MPVFLILNWASFSFSLRILRCHRQCDQIWRNFTLLAKKLKVFGQFLDFSFSIWQPLGPTQAFLCYGAICHCCKRRKIEQYYRHLYTLMSSNKSFVSLSIPIKSFLLSAPITFQQHKKQKIKKYFNIDKFSMMELIGRIAKLAKIKFQN